MATSNGGASFDCSLLYNATMRRFCRGAIASWLLAASLGSLACGRAVGGTPTSEATESGAPGDAGRVGGSSSSSGGSPEQAGSVAVGGGAVLVPSGGATTTAGASGAGEAAETPHAARPCDDPQPYPQGGGYLVCQDKSLRLAEPAACPTTLPRAAPTDPLVFDECALDSDCTTAAHGFCAYGQCKYGCVSNDECAANQLCFCGVDVGQCLAADCLRDADCPAGYPCTGNLPFGETNATFQCQTPVDSCESDYDCPGPREHCVSDGDGQRRYCRRDLIG
jgi:hypothetical protein